MNLEPSPRAAELRLELLDFMEQHVYPSEAIYKEEIAASMDPHHHPAVIETLKVEARRRGLWNLFLPHKADHTDGLTNVDYAPLAEIAGRSVLGPETMNCSAPDTGNMEILSLFGTDEQKARWLTPLLEGQIRSCFAMTEPAVASSDATNIECRIERQGDDYVINGRKWWISGVGDHRCELIIVMGKTDPDGPRHRQQSMVIVPMSTPGVTKVRSLPVFGYFEQPGHYELVFDDVRVPAANVLGNEGDGFTIAQSRLGPGRIHHCMRTIGAAERALGLMCERVQRREAFGRPLAEQGVIQQWIADSRVEIDQARLLTMRAAWLMDTVGNKAARSEIAAIKVIAPSMALRVIDRAIQAHGAAGVGDDLPLASMYASIRTLRIADGPDEVHRRTIAREELARHAV